MLLRIVSDMVLFMALSNNDPLFIWSFLVVLSDRVASRVFGERVLFRVLDDRVLSLTRRHTVLFKVLIDMVIWFLSDRVLFRAFNMVVSRVFSERVAFRDLSDRVL